MDADFIKDSGGSGSDFSMEKWYEDLIYSIAEEIESERQKLLPEIAEQISSPPTP